MIRSFFYNDIILKSTSNNKSAERSLPMLKLTWLGHACFALEAEGYRILLDP